MIELIVIIAMILVASFVAGILFKVLLALLGLVLIYKFVKMIF